MSVSPLLRQELTVAADTQRTNAIAHHVEAYGVVTELLQNNRTRQSSNDALNPLAVHVIRPLAEKSTELTMQGLKKAYFYTAQTIARTASRVTGRDMSESITNLFYDPASTKSLSCISSIIHTVSLLMAKRQPLNLPVLHYVDTCLIVAGRHLYFGNRDAAILLEFPKKLRTAADEITRAALEEIVYPLEADGVARGREMVANARNQPEPDAQENLGWLASLQKKVIYGARVAAGYTTAAGAKGAGFGATVILDAANGQFKNVITLNEKKVRQMIVAKAADSICRSIIRCLATAFISYFAYELMGRGMTRLMTHVSLESRQQIENMAYSTSFCIMILGNMLWINCLLPTVERLHRSYQASFNPETSSFREAAGMLNSITALQTFKDALAAGFVDEADETRVGRFRARIAQASARLLYNDGPIPR